jgi:hypothetical protein
LERLYYPDGAGQRRNLSFLTENSLPLQRPRLILAASSTKLENGQRNHEAYEK